MKLKQELVDILHNGLEIGHALGIEAIVMDNISLRGENRETSTNIIFNMDNVEIPFDGMGIGRVSLLRSRLAMLDHPTVDVSTKEKDGQTDASSVIITEGRTKVEFRCQTPSRIRAPKRINDEIIFDLLLNDDDITKINKGINTMSSDKIILYIEDGKAVIAISDLEGDIFTHEIEGECEPMSKNSPTSFNQTYKSKTFKTILLNYMKKDNNEVLPISITSRGVMKIRVLGIDIYLFGEV